MRFTQKMGGCQSRTNPLHGSPNIGLPLFVYKRQTGRQMNPKEDPMNTEQIPVWQRWAQFRFAVIGELLS